MSEFDRHEQLMEIDYVHKEERMELQSLLNTDSRKSMHDLASILHKNKVTSKRLEQDLVQWKASKAN